MNEKIKWSDMTNGQRIIYVFGIAYIIAIYSIILFVIAKIAISYVF